MIDIDDDVAVDVSTVVTAAIHVTTLEAAVQVGSCSVTRIAVSGNIVTFLIPNKGVPLQQLRLVVLILPSHGPDAQIGEVQCQLVTRRGVRIGNQSTIIRSIIGTSGYEGIIAATHQFVEDDKRTGEL